MFSSLAHINQGTYKPTSYLFTTFLQNLYGVLETTPYIRYEREFLQTPDGGEIALGRAVFIHRRAEPLFCAPSEICLDMCVCAVFLRSGVSEVLRTESS